MGMRKRRPLFNRHKVAKAHPATLMAGKRHKEKKGQSDKGVEAQSRKIRPLCPSGGRLQPTAGSLL
jgi:hypothetical protein